MRSPRRRSAQTLLAAGRILAFGRGLLPTRPECSNIASAVGVAQYVAITAEIAWLLGRGRILDWGAGWGQNSLLLSTHGFEVVAYDVEDNGAASGLLATTNVRYVVEPGSRLPFADGEFDGVLNCGVLEHVDDEAQALAELRRILRPNGLLFTYHLPNRHAYTEWLARRLGRFHHERTYTLRQAVSIFERAGFRVLACRPFHMLPRNIWGRLATRLALSEGLARTCDALDTALVRLPGLGRFATAWALILRRDDLRGRNL